MQQNWNLGLGYAFPSFCIRSQVLAKAITEKLDYLIISAYPGLVCSTVLYVNTKSTLVTIEGKSSCESIESNASSDNNNKLRLATWKVPNRALDHKEFQAKLPNLCESLGGQARFQIMNRPGESLLADLVKNKFIHFVAL